MVPTVLVMSFGLLMCFDPFCARLVQWLDKTDSFIAIPHEQRLDWKLPPCLRVLRHAYRRGLDWFQQHWSFRLGYSCVSPVCCMEDAHSWTKRTLLGFVGILHEQDGSRPSLLFAGTSACIQKRSGLVPTVSVISFGFETVFWKLGTEK